MVAARGRQPNKPILPTALRVAADCQVVGQRAETGARVVYACSRPCYRAAWTWTSDP
jgi:hypothetical protein